MPIYHFDDIGDFAREVAKVSASCRNRDRSWTNGESFHDSVCLARDGNDALVPEAQKILDQLATSIELSKPGWVPSVMGAYPVVPEAIIGLPDPMRRKTDVSSDTAPIKVFVCTTSSAGVSSETLMKRGTAILALVLGLAAVRPIELYVHTELDGRRDGSESSGSTIIVNKINTQPLNIGQAAQVLTSSGYDRNLTHTFGWAHSGYTGGWAKNFRNREKMAELLGATERDLVIPPTHLDDTLVRDPIAWVKDKLANYEALLDA